ncbi:MAG: hypothetical protein RL748_10 [Pseudomonadota bacterium]|jgi:2-hydroxychromene-2-carboxylate isomerase
MDFYFDFVSPYGYMAAMKIEALAARYGRTVNWFPILLGAVFKTTGAVPLVAIPIKGDYVLHDMARTARFHNIPFTFPQPFPLGTQLAARATYFLQDQHGGDAAARFSQSIYQAYFVNGQNIAEPEVVAACANACGFDGAAVAEAVQSAPLKERLKQEIEQAMARGVFGSPFVIVDGESFWGFDHFYQIEALLRDGKI